LLAITASAETVYVSDQLETYMRSGKGNQYRIVRTLPSGTSLQVLGTEGDFSKVRAPSGAEGWVLSRFLMTNRPARDRLGDLEQHLAQLELENGKLTTELEKVRGAKADVQSDQQTLLTNNQKLTQQLEEIKHTASSALAIDAENKELKSRVVGYERQLQTLRQENEGLRDRTARDWFMVGAGVMIMGMVIGLIIPRIRWRRKSSWDTL